MTNFEVIMKEHPVFIKKILANCVAEIVLEKVVAGDHEQHVYYTAGVDKKCMDFLNAEYVVPVLDDIEKKYLSNIIRPFKHNVKSIRKSICSGQYFIEINMEDFHDRVTLPYFSTNSEMYKGMKERVDYTLEELGL